MAIVGGPMRRENAIEQNIHAHDIVSDVYDDVHGEIFNPVEQSRLRVQLAQAIEYITTNREPLVALDYGCGSGNLTRHLLALGLHVVAADVSREFLRIVTSRFGASDSIGTLAINGRDLSTVSNDSYDLTATYSVLHHVPDYLSIVRELARVTRSGGVIYLDHEFSDGYWRMESNYKLFLAAVQPPVKRSWKRFLVASNYLTLIRRKFNPRYQPEGDIHVWPDDHIEWDKIASVLNDSGCAIVHEQDYLLFKRGYSRAVHAAYQTKCHDTHVLIAKKL